MTPHALRIRLDGVRRSAWRSVAAIICVSFLLVGAEISASSWLTTAALSLASGVAALSLMGGSAILGGRLGWIEDLFGGLDRVYAVHKWLGIYALVLASVHLLFKADLRIWDTAAILGIPSDWARLARQASFVGLMLIAILALNRKIPYGVWRWWHRLSGPIFLVVVLHWLSIKSPIALASPAGIWLAVIASLGGLVSAWKLILYPAFARHAEYRVVEVVRSSSAVQIDLMPTGPRVDFKPGQFGFLQLKAQGLREPHPFTIAAAPTSEGRLTFVVRSLGDYTADLVASIDVGMRANIYAPYGRFLRPVGARREIWIAGGVGISPFMSWVSDKAARDFDRVTMFYFYTEGRGFPNVEVVKAMADASGIEFVPVTTGPKSTIFRRRFLDIVPPHDPSMVRISVCGPSGLADAVMTFAAENGIDPRSINSERFEFR